jgi:hypothetical protein
VRTAAAPEKWGTRSCEDVMAATARGHLLQTMKFDNNGLTTPYFKTLERFDRLTA